MKKTETIAVGCGCILKDGKYLIAKRQAAKGGLWEFPGGKRERGESIQECLKREIREELGISVSVSRHFFTKTWQDGDRRWKLYFCRCRILKGRPRALEHARLKWVGAGEFAQYELPKANAQAVKRLQQMRT